MAKEKDEKPLSPLDRMIARALGDEIPLGTPLDPVRTKCPNLWACMSVTKAGGEHLMSPARLSFSLTPGGVLVGLSSQALAFSIDTPCVLLIEGFEAMEAALTGPAPAFRTWDNKDFKLRKKRKEGGQN